VVCHGDNNADKLLFAANLTRLERSKWGVGSRCKKSVQGLTSLLRSVFRHNLPYSSRSPSSDSSSYSLIKRFRLSTLPHSLCVLSLLLLLLFQLLLSLPARGADIALIIDDIGNKPEDIDAFSLPSEITFAILPHTPYSTSFSQLAEQQQREVMLHIPMESLSGKALGPGALTAAMLPDDIKAHLEAAHESVPNAIAINNHMGSKLTQLTLPMKATMEYLHDKGLYFVDSRTTRYSRAERIATQLGVPNLHRHVFLDHLPEPRHIAMQFKRLRGIANKHGKAVGIAHPYPQTLAYLKANLPQLRKQGFRLVTLSEVMQGDAGQLAMQAYRAKNQSGAITRPRIIKKPVLKSNASPKQ